MGNIEKRFGLELKQDGGYFYLILAFISFYWALSIGLTRALGVFIPVWMGSYGISMTTSSFIFVLITTGSCLNSFCGPFILGWLGSRNMMILGSLGSSVSWIVAWQFNELIYIQLAIGLLNSFFFNMQFYTSNIVFQGWMNEKRIFGNGVVFAGVPIGGLLFSPFWTFLFDKFSWKGACLVQAGISLQTLWISLLIIECPASPIDKERKPFDWSLLTSGPIMMFAFSQSLYFCSYSSILLLVPYMMGKGFSPIDSALAVTTQAVAEIVMRPVFATALNKFDKNKIHLMTIACVMLSCSLIITVLGTSYTSFMVIAAIQGASIAFCGGLPTSIICDLCGYQGLPTAFVLYSLALDSSFMFGPLLYSNLSDNFFPELIYIAATGVGILSVFAVIGTKFLVKPEEPSTISTSIYEE